MIYPYIYISYILSVFWISLAFGILESSLLVVDPNHEALAKAPSNVVPGTQVAIPSSLSFRWKIHLSLKIIRDILRWYLLFGSFEIGSVEVDGMSWCFHFGILIDFLGGWNWFSTWNSFTHDWRGTETTHSDSDVEMVGICFLHFECMYINICIYRPQKANISHPWKRKIIFKSDFWWDMWLFPGRYINWKFERNWFFMRCPTVEQSHQCCVWCRKSSNVCMQNKTICLQKPPMSCPRTNHPQDSEIIRSLVSQWDQNGYVEDLILPLQHPWIN